MTISTIIKNNLCILDPFFDSKGFELLNSAVERNSEINEIRIISDMKKIISTYGMHPLDKVKQFRSLTKRFKEAKFGRDVTIKMIISSDLTQKNENVLVWNSGSELRNFNLINC